MKKTLAFIIALTAVGASTMPLMAETETVNGYTWTYRINGDTVEIGNGRSVAISPNPIGTVSIPSMFSGRIVTRIGSYAFSDCDGLASVTIPDSVTRIGRMAFSPCSGLTNVTMRGNRPDVPKDSNDIFQGCDKLKAIHVPANAKSWTGMKEWMGVSLVFDGKDDAPAHSHTDTTQGMSVAAKKLQSCDFLLNKDFKRNAKVYLCLFSASWCPPCRGEMPRIAKTYTEMLKGDSDIELIHFSCDQDDEKALSWAKEHDVKFPVVKPNVGNPLDLHARGIPHLFIVKADGTIVEEGHPMKLFTDAKLRELKTAENL